MVTGGSGQIVVIKRDGNVGSGYSVLGGSITIGSGKDCDIRVPVKGFAQKQCIITVDGNEATIKNLSTELPTVINGKPVDTKVLGHGDILSFSSGQFQWNYFNETASSSHESKSKGPSFVAKRGKKRKGRRKSEPVVKKVDPSIRKIMETKGRNSLHSLSGGRRSVGRKSGPLEIGESASRRRKPNEVEKIVSPNTSVSYSPKARQVAVVMPQRRDAPGLLITPATPSPSPTRPHSSTGGRRLLGRKSGPFSEVRESTSKRKKTHEVEKIETPVAPDKNKRAALMLLTGRSPANRIIPKASPKSSPRTVGKPTIAFEDLTVSSDSEDKAMPLDVDIDATPKGASRSNNQSSRKIPMGNADFKVLRVNLLAKSTPSKALGMSAKYGSATPKSGPPAKAGSAKPSASKATKTPALKNIKIAAKTEPKNVRGSKLPRVAPKTVSPSATKASKLPVKKNIMERSVPKVSLFKTKSPAVVKATSKVTPAKAAALKSSLVNSALVKSTKKSGRKITPISEVSAKSSGHKTQPKKLALNKVSPDKSVRMSSRDALPEKLASPLKPSPRKTTTPAKLSPKVPLRQSINRANLMLDNLSIVKLTPKKYITVRTSNIKDTPEANLSKREPVHVDTPRPSPRRSMKVTPKIKVSKFRRTSKVLKLFATPNIVQASPKDTSKSSPWVTPTKSVKSSPVRVSPAKSMSSNSGSYATPKELSPVKSAKSSPVRTSLKGSPARSVKSTPVKVSPKLTPATKAKSSPKTSPAKRAKSTPAKGSPKVSPVKSGNSTLSRLSPKATPTKSTKLTPAKASPVVSLVLSAKSSPKLTPTKTSLKISPNKSTKSTPTRASPKVTPAKSAKSTLAKVSLVVKAKFSPKPKQVKSAKSTPVKTRMSKSHKSTPVRASPKVSSAKNAKLTPKALSKGNLKPSPAKVTPRRKKTLSGKVNKLTRITPSKFYSNNKTSLVKAVLLKVAKVTPKSTLVKVAETLVESLKKTPVKSSPKSAKVTARSTKKSLSVQTHSHSKLSPSSPRSVRKSTQLVTLSSALVPNRKSKSPAPPATPPRITMEASPRLKSVLKSPDSKSRLIGKKSIAIKFDLSNIELNSSHLTQESHYSIGTPASDKSKSPDLFSDLSCTGAEFSSATSGDDLNLYSFNLATPQGKKLYAETLNNTSSKSTDLSGSSKSFGRRTPTLSDSNIRHSSFVIKSIKSVTPKSKRPPKRRSTPQKKNSAKKSVSPRGPLNRSPQTMLILSPIMSPRQTSITSSASSQGKNNSTIEMTPNLSKLFEIEASTPKVSRRSSVQDTIKQFEAKSVSTPTKSVIKVTRKSLGTLGSRVQKRKSQLEALNSKSKTEPKKRLQGIQKAQLRRDRKLLNISKPINSFDEVSNSSDKTDINAPQPENEIVITPKSTMKLIPEILKEKHSTAKKSVSKKAMIDHLTDFPDIAKELFKSPVKRKLSQSITQYNTSLLMDDLQNASIMSAARDMSFNASLASKKSGRSGKRTPNSSFDFNSVKTPLVPTEHFVSAVGDNFDSQKTRKTPRNDLTDVAGVKELFQFNRKSPKNELINFAGVKRLLKTPRPQTSPFNDLSKFNGVKELFSRKSPKNDLTNVAGVKKLLKTPRPQKSPINDLSKFNGVKALFNTSTRAQKSPRNDLVNIVSAKSLFKTPKGQRSPKNSLENVSGVAEIFNSPSPKGKKSITSESLFDSLTQTTQLKTYSKSPKNTSSTYINQSSRNNSKNEASTAIIEDSMSSRSRRQVTIDKTNFSIEVSKVQPQKSPKRLKVDDVSILGQSTPAKLRKVPTINTSVINIKQLSPILSMPLAGPSRQLAASPVKAQAVGSKKKAPAKKSGVKKTIGKKAPPKKSTRGSKSSAVKLQVTEEVVKIVTKPKKSAAEEVKPRSTRGRPAKSSPKAKPEISSGTLNAKSTSNLSVSKKKVTFAKDVSTASPPARSRGTKGAKKPAAAAKNTVKSKASKKIAKVEESFEESISPLKTKKVPAKNAKATKKAAPKATKQPANKSPKKTRAKAKAVVADSPKSPKKVPAAKKASVKSPKTTRAVVSSKAAKTSPIATKSSPKASKKLVKSLKSTKVAPASPKGTKEKAVSSKASKKAVASPKAAKKAVAKSPKATRNTAVVASPEPSKKVAIAKSPMKAKAKAAAKNKAAPKTKAKAAKTSPVNAPAGRGKKRGAIEDNPVLSPKKAKEMPKVTVAKKTTPNKKSPVAKRTTRQKK